MLIIFSWSEFLNLHLDMDTKVHSTYTINSVKAQSFVSPA